MTCETSAVAVCCSNAFRTFGLTLGKPKPQFGLFALAIVKPVVHNVIDWRPLRVRNCSRLQRFGRGSYPPWGIKPVPAAEVARPLSAAKAVRCLPRRLSGQVLSVHHDLGWSMLSL